MNSDLYSIGRIIEVQRRRHKFKTNEYQASGAIPIIDQSTDFIAGFTDEVDRAYDGELPVIIFGDHTCCLKFIDFRFAVGADGTQLLRPVEGIDARYLYYGLHAVDLKQFGYQRHFKLLKDCEVRVPPLDTQRRIATILGTYDDLIEVNRRRIAVLEEMARGLFEEWFVRFRFPGHEAVPILDTQDGPLPEGWRRATVSDAFELLRGRSYRSVELADEGGMPFVNLKCMERDGGFRVSGLKRFTGDFKPSHAVVRGDIVLAVTDMTQERRIIGRAARIPLLDEPEAVISMDLVKVRPREGIDQSFLYCWLRYSDFGIKAAQHANGANVLHLSPKAIVDLPFVLPPSNSQAEFGRIVEPFFALAEVLAVSERRLSASRDLLLPRLISGQLSVAEAERQLEKVA